MERLRAAADIMVTRLTKLSPETEVLPAISQIVEKRITGAPVVDSGNTYLGVFSERCSLEALVEAAEQFPGFLRGSRAPQAGDVMETSLVLLNPDLDAIEAIGVLLANRISGAPVVDSDGRFLGVFSEKTSMSVVLGSAYDLRPSSSVRAVMDADRGRTISADLDLLSICRLFSENHYRRLDVLDGERLLGQISRRDALQAALGLAKRLDDAPIRHARVGQAMDCAARTIEPTLDLLSIATIFQETPYRRLPVLDGDLLAGIVSRRDVLSAARQTLATRKKPGAQPLYLSAVKDQPPSFG